MKSTKQEKRLHPLAAVCFFLSLMPVVMFGVVFTIGGLQNLGYAEDVNTAPYEPWVKPVMLAFSLAAVILSYRAESRMVMSNGFYSGAWLTRSGRTVGFALGGLVLLTILLWGI